MVSESYIVPLKRAYEKPRTKRANVAVKEIYDFLFKHTRKERQSIVLTSEVNEYLWKKGIQKPPRKIAISLKENEGKLYVFLKDSKNIEGFFKKMKTEKPSKSFKDKVEEMKESMQKPTAKKTTSKTQKESPKKEVSKHESKKAKESSSFKEIKKENIPKQVKDEAEAVQSQAEAVQSQAEAINSQAEAINSQAEAVKSQEEAIHSQKEATKSQAEEVNSEVKEVKDEAEESKS